MKQESPIHPFITQGGVGHELTSYFLNLDKPGEKENFIAALEEFYEEVPEREDPSRGVYIDPKTGEILDAYGLTTDCWYTHTALSVAIGLGSVNGRRVLEDFSAIADGRLVLSEAQKQMLSNISNGGLHTARSVLGLFDKDDFQFPLLDIGTGEKAWLARDLLKEYPEETVVSTSMHLALPESQMRKNLAQLSLKEVGMLVACNAENLPFPDNSFQQVISINAVPCYVPKASLPKVFKNIHRVLKPGGTALLCAAMCDYGKSDVEPKDIKPLQQEIDIELVPIGRLGRAFYSPDVTDLIKITK